MSLITRGGHSRCYPAAPARRSLLPVLVLLMLLSLAASAQILDFSLTTVGPHHVVQGHYMIFSAVASILSGVDAPGTVPSVSGLPAGATGEFMDMQRFCCATYLYGITGANPIKISTSSSTPVGTYTLQVTFKTVLGLQRSVSYTIYVDPAPSVVQKPGNYYPADVPLASLTQYNTDMVTHGRQHCTSSETGVYSMYNVDYYDGTRVYYQIADYTGDTSWNACADMVYTAYSTYVNANNGRIPGYSVFSHGLAMRAQRLGDSAARNTLSALQANAAYTNWPDPAYIVDWGVSREVAYAIETNLQYQAIGAPANPHLQDLVEAQLGHFDQWFQSKTAPMAQPFMVGLAAEALIEYWNVSHDPRIPPILQLAADQMWATSFETSCDCFRYYKDDPINGTWSVTTDLNLLIAPLYGWLYQQTGAQVYRDEGDRIFNSGVAGAWLDGGKQFSQNYRWSAKYIQWRTLAATTGGQPSGTPSCDLNADGQVNVIDVQKATNQALGSAACGNGDLNRDGSCSVVDVMRVVSASLGATCNTAP